MSRVARDPLRWYPPAWRARYGDELRALMEDHSGAGGPGLTERVSLARHGLAERARDVFLFRHGAPQESRWRGGALLVLVAWAAFVLGGAGFAKASEHFGAAVPTGSRALPQAAGHTVFVGGLVGGALVLAGALGSVPAFVRLLRAGGWPSLRGHFVRAAAVTGVTVVLTVPLVLWAHGLSVHGRNGGNAAYGTAFVAWVVVIAATLGSWTAVAVAIGRNLVTSRRMLRVEAIVAVALAVVMLVVTVATATWWGAVAASAPGFLGRTPFDAPVVAAMALMVTGLAVSTGGVVRIVRR